ncbi:hypothetical protein SOVF_101410 [Spinacia oleracea]|nr:hypothetical protein SOVF_101410 [Spinacia oleracea]
MKVFVKNLKGTYFQIEVNPQQTIADVKKNIEYVQGENDFPASQQMLIYQGKVLTDTTTLEENKVGEKSFIVVTLIKSKSSSGRSSAATAGVAVPTSKAPATPVSPSTEASATPPTNVPDVAFPASAPTSTPDPIVSSSVPESDDGGQVAKNLVAGKDIEHTIQHILDIGGGIWDRDTVVDALRVASNNPERAVQYLKSSKSSPGESSVAAAAATPTSEASSSPESSSVEASATPPITVAGASLPASTPTSVPGPIISSSLPESDVDGHVASNLVARNNYENTIQHILDMGGGVWNRETVMRALHAASNNPEIAVAYLYSGIPEQAKGPSSAQSLGQPKLVPANGPSAGPQNIFARGLRSVGSDAAPAGSLDFLRNSEQFQALRAMVQANPQVLQPMLQEFGKQNPNLMRLIQEHQTEFNQLLNEPVEENILEQVAAATPQALQVTPTEHAAIERLEAMGFDRSSVLEVYFACNKNEELTANYLLDHIHEL